MTAVQSSLWREDFHDFHLRYLPAQLSGSRGVLAANRARELPAICFRLSNSDNAYCYHPAAQSIAIVAGTIEIKVSEIKVSELSVGESKKSPSRAIDAGADAVGVSDCWDEAQIIELDGDDWRQLIADSHTFALAAGYSEQQLQLFERWRPVLVAMFAVSDVASEVI